MGQPSWTLNPIFYLSWCEYVQKKLYLLLGGDFNIIRSPDEKNNDNYSDR
jgi:hypothetical protein